MFMISVALQTNVVWALQFKDQDLAAKAWQEIKKTVGPVSVSDEFGQTFACDDVSKIAGLFFEDSEQSQAAQIERSLHQTRMQFRVEKIARADPEIMSAMRTRQGGGPAVLSPMGANGGRGF